jgi:hypothetical protein
VPPRPSAQQATITGVNCRWFPVHDLNLCCRSIGVVGRSSVDRAARKVTRTPGANADGIGCTRSNGIIRAGTIPDRPLPFYSRFVVAVTGYSAWSLLLAMQRMRRLPIERKAAQ